MAKKPDFIVYGKTLNGHWKKCGVAWRNKSTSKVGYVKVALDFMPSSGELTIWHAEDRKRDAEPADSEPPPFDSREDLAPTLVEDAD